MCRVRRRATSCKDNGIYGPIGNVDSVTYRRNCEVGWRWTEWPSVTPTGTSNGQEIGDFPRLLKRSSLTRHCISNCVVESSK
jgi:hypothetical protein